MRIEYLNPDSNGSYNQRAQLLKINEIIAAVNSMLPDEEIEEAVIQELTAQQKG